jgi:hypothetical protein
MSDAVLVPLILGGVATLLGLVFTGIGVIRGRMVRDWMPTTGIVVSRRTGRADGGMAAIYPTFRWEDQHGRVHQRTSMVRASLGPRPGTHVPVRFDPDDPSRAMIDTYVQSGRIFYAIGGALLGLGVVVLLVAGWAAVIT